MRQLGSGRLRRAVEALRPSGRAPSRPAPRGASRAPAGPPLVSLVVAVTDDDATHLDECLASLRAQTHRELEILVLPHGTRSEAEAAAREHAAEDQRVLVRTCAEADPGAVRNRGADASQGRYLAFVPPSDVLPPTAVEALARSLEETGSDLAVGRVADKGGSGPHLRRRYETSVVARHTHVTDVPGVVGDLRLGNRLFRASFWRDQGLGFPESDELLPGSTLTRAYLGARALDVLDQVTYHDMRRAGGRAFGYQYSSLGDLDAWSAQARLLSTETSSLGPGVHAAWLEAMLDVEVVHFLDDAERADDSQWQAMVAVVGWLLEQAGDEVWPRLRAESKVKLWLAAHDRRERLEEHVADRWFEYEQMPTEVRDGTVYATYPPYREPDAGVPDDCFALAPQETWLRCSLRAARWRDGRLELDLFAFVEYVDLAGGAPLVEAALLEEGTGRRLALDVEHRADPAVSRFARHRYQDYDNGAVTVTVDTGRLAAETMADSSTAWRLEVTVTAQGVTRTGPVTHRDEQSPAETVTGRVLDGARISVAEPGTRGLVLHVEPCPFSVTELSMDERQVTGRVTGTGAVAPAGVQARRREGRPVDAEWVADSAGGRFALPLPEPGPPGYRLQVLAQDGTAWQLPWPSADPSSWVTPAQPGDWALHRTTTGGCALQDVRGTVAVESLRVEGDRLAVAGRVLGRLGAAPALELRRDSTSVRAPLAVHGAALDAELVLRHLAWGEWETALTSGRYRLTVISGEEGREVRRPAAVGDDLATADPSLVDPSLAARHAGESGRKVTGRQELVGESHRVRARRTARGALALTLSAPLTDDELGPVRQTRLQAWYADRAAELEDIVYLQSYTGETATDSVLAIHHELRRRRPELTCYWGVADKATVLPDGAVPVLIRSREWYDVLARARYLVSNINFERWFRKAPGQRFLEVFHGYPAKSIGVQLWESKQFTPRRIERMLRTSRDWDLILTPVPEIDAVYRTEYRYRGAILSEGYPRDDLLLSPDADRVRAETRRRLGIRDDQTVVLYAPTWRDDLATNPRAAALVAHLDVESAGEALGDGYVMLLRGHRFHPRAAAQKGARQGAARWLDVGDYPEVNDLILASDVGVFDYSSIRFDFALTRRPMIFLVPDLDRYSGSSRGFLFDFADSAPGPLLDTQEEVVEQLRDVEGLRRRYAEQVERFVTRYQYRQDDHSAQRVVEAFFTG